MTTDYAAERKAFHRQRTPPELLHQPLLLARVETLGFKTYTTNLLKAHNYECLAHVIGGKPIETLRGASLKTRNDVQNALDILNKNYGTSFALGKFTLPLILIPTQEKKILDAEKGLREFFDIDAEANPPIEFMRKPSAPAAPPKAQPVRHRYSSTNLMTAHRELSTLVATPGFEPMPFYVKDQHIGYIIPKSSLVTFLASHREEPAVKVTSTTLKKAYLAYRDESYQPPAQDEKSATLIRIAQKDGEPHCLTIVSKSLYQEIAKSPPAPVVKPEKPARKSMPYIAPEKIHYKEGGAIAAACALGKAAQMNCIATDLIAIPVKIARQLQKNILPGKGDDYFTSITSFDFNHRRFDLKSLEQGKKALIVTRYETHRPDHPDNSTFAVMPAYLLAFLDMNRHGVITGIKKTQNLAFDFQATATLKMQKSSASIIVRKADQNGAAGWVALLDKFSASAAPSTPGKSETLKTLPNIPATISGTLKPDGSISSLKVEFQAQSFPDTLLKLQPRHSLHIGSQIFHLPLPQAAQIS